MWNQTGITVRKRLSWVVTSVTLTFDLWPWPFAWTLPWSAVTTSENFMMIRWWEHSQKGVTDGQTDRQTDWWTENTIHRAAWSQLKIQDSSNKSNAAKSYAPDNDDHLPKWIDQTRCSELIGQVHTHVPSPIVWWTEVHLVMTLHADTLHESAEMPCGDKHSSSGVLFSKQKYNSFTWYIQFVQFVCSLFLGKGGQGSIVYRAAHLNTKDE